jgi:hypothetical protein
MAAPPYTFPRKLATVPAEEGVMAGGWWREERIGADLPAQSRDDPVLRNFLSRYGWL